MRLETSRPDHSEIPASNFISKDRFDRKSPPYMVLSCLLRWWKCTYFPDGCLAHIWQITLKLASWPSEYSKCLEETKKVMLDMSFIKEVSCNLAFGKARQYVLLIYAWFRYIFTHQKKDTIYWQQRVKRLRPDSKAPPPPPPPPPRIDVDYTPVRRHNVGSMSNQRQSEGFHYSGWCPHDTIRQWPYLSMAEQGMSE